MGNIFFTSDTHWNHTNIIKYCNRPYETVEEMNEGLINNWNSQVKSNDLVFFLGDLLMGTNEKLLNALIKSINGNIILIRGNHDHYTNQQYINCGIKAVYDLLSIDLKGYKFILCHYQMQQWQDSYKGSFHLYGHEHDRQLYPFPHPIYKQLGISEKKQNVCIDSNKYFLYSLDQIIENLKLKPTNWWKNNNEH